MYEKIVLELENKHIAILGFGREGKSTYRFIEKHCKFTKVSILDMNDIRDDFNQEFKKEVDFVIGDNYLDNLEKYDLIIKSPGISFIGRDISKFKDKISSQLELLLKVFSKNAIGVTGTKGKSTTVSLLYEMIKEQRDNVYLIGNIGVPVLDKVEEYNEDSILIIEISSHQLEYLNSSPHIGIILNLFEDHLDKAGTLKNYHEIKMRMFRNQNFNDVALYLADNQALMDQIKKSVYLSNTYGVSDIIRTDIYKEGTSYFFRGKELFNTEDEKNLLGHHNDLNIVFALAVIVILSLDLAKAREVVKNFKPVEYRNEAVGLYDGINFYVDTLATIPEATIASIKSLKQVDTLIFGGLDRGIDYSPLVEFLKESDIKVFICMPSTGYKIGVLLKDRERYFIDDLKKAVEIAKQKTAKGGVCLLSPAAASYEYYRDYKEKAEAYISFVKNIEKQD